MLRHRRTRVFLALAGLFAFRLFYGLSMRFWFEDERQVYLIGLRSFARGEWPYFGADVVWTGGQLPGALLGWLIRLPLHIWPAPEAPVVFLNVLSFAGLALLAWYLGRRLPRVPPWLIWSALSTLPWTLNFSTHVINPSFVIPGAIVFFVGFFEGAPFLRRGIIPFALAWSMMGFGLLWVVQLHLSWVLFVPYVVLALIWTGARGMAGLTRATTVVHAVAAFLLGAAAPAALLVPTLLQFGWGAGQARTAIEFHLQSPIELLTTAARVLSFASFEVNRFLGSSTAERVLAIVRQPLIAIAMVPVLVAGVIHPVWMAVSAFRRTTANASDWLHVRWLLASTVALIFGSYFFSIREAQAHAFYVVFPVSALFAFTCWDARTGGRSRRLEQVAAIVIGCNVAMHIGLALDRLPRESLYVDRPLVVAAIAGRNDRYLGDRRDTVAVTQNREPRAFDNTTYVDAYRSAAATDLKVTSARWTPFAGRISSFELTVSNQSRAAWLDLRLAATYKDAAGAVVATREVVIRQILQPGESRRWTDVADGWTPERATNATIALTSAEKVIPRVVVMAHRNLSSPY